MKIDDENTPRDKRRIMGSYLETFMDRKKWAWSRKRAQQFQNHEKNMRQLGFGLKEFQKQNYWNLTKITSQKKGNERKSDFKFYHIQTIKSIVSYIIRTHLNWTRTIKRRPFIKKPSATFECILFYLSIFIHY